MCKSQDAVTEAHHHFISAGVDREKDRRRLGRGGGQLPVVRDEPGRRGGCLDGLFHGEHGVGSYGRFWGKVQDRFDSSRSETGYRVHSSGERKKTALPLSSPEYVLTFGSVHA